ncbi:MAG: hypothetical protein ACJAYO_000300, partial [Thalassolituus oleivorans]
MSTERQAIKLLNRKQKKPANKRARLLINPSYLTGVYCFWGLCINIPLI